MNHILVADRVWLGRLAGRVPEPGFIGVDGIKSLDQEHEPSDRGEAIVTLRDRDTPSLHPTWLHALSVQACKASGAKDARTKEAKSA